MNDCDGGGQEVQKEFDWSETLPSIAIVRAVAALEDVDQSEVATVCGMPLFDAVDPDALDKLVTSADAISLSFSFNDYSVDITDSTVVVSDD